MNCETYQSMLATLPIDELTHSDARTHVATCRDCDRVSRVVAERERNMLMAFGELYPPTPADPVAVRALEVSRRRKIGVYYRVGLGAVVSAALLSIVVARVVPSPNAMVNETFRLHCLSPEQAIEIVGRGSKNMVVYAGPAAPNVINIAAPAEELTRIRALMDIYDNPSASQCRVQPAEPKATRAP